MICSLLTITLILVGSSSSSLALDTTIETSNFFLLTSSSERNFKNARNTTQPKQQQPLAFISHNHVGDKQTKFSLSSKSVVMRKKYFGFSNNNNNNNNSKNRNNNNVDQRTVTKPIQLRMSTEDESSSSSEFDELSTQLARLDRQWQLQKNRPGQWQKIVLKEGTNSSFDAKFDITSGKFIKEECIYLLEPPPPTGPSSVILFLGGAVLGQFPHIAYSEFLSRLSRRLNASIIAAPYEVKLDHFDLSKTCGELLRNGLVHCEEYRGYNEQLPKFLLSHSLGSKLSAIDVAATGLASDNEIVGLGFLSYNNFSFRDTVGMARSFAKDLGLGSKLGGMGGGVGGGGDSTSSKWLDTILNVVEQAVSFTGTDFKPNPTDMGRILEMKYSTNVNLMQKTRLFKFDDDDLDCSRSFLEICGENKEEDTNHLSIAGLTGSHLTPVYFKLGVEDFPEEARSITATFQGASFGNEDHLNEAVDEVCAWMMGKEPTRGPVWKEQAEQQQQNSNDLASDRRLPGEVADTTVL